MTPYLLLAAAIALAWPVPVLLARASWVQRAPVAAMLLWQAVGLAGGVTMIGAPLMWGLAPFGHGLLSALGTVIDLAEQNGLSAVLTADGFTANRIVGVTLGLVLAAHLVLTLLVSTRSTLRNRSRHRRAVELLTQPGQLSDTTSSTGQMRVLPLDHPLAYCLPGITNSLTVISRGLIDQLNTQQLDAVIAHEQAHLKQRHDLLRLAFEAWNRACAWLPTSSTARTAVTELTEMLADDATLRHHDRDQLVSALAMVGSTGASTGPVADADPSDAVAAAKQSPARLSRLLNPPGQIPSWISVLNLVAAVILVISPMLLILLG